MRRKQIQEIVESSLKDIAPHAEFDEYTRIYAMGEGLLDSLALVELMVTIEEKFHALGHNVSLSAKDAMSQQRTPFKNVPTIVEWVTEETSKCDIL